MVVRCLYIIVLVALAFLIHWGCTELGEGIKVHPDRWADPGGGIHGDKVALAGLESCTQCHGQELDGGTAGVTCDNCHSGGGAIPHPEKWGLPGSDFHGDYVKTAGITPCKKCHGDDLGGGIAQMACSNTTCHTGGKTIPHPPRAEFIDPTHANYHGGIFWENNWDFSYCQTCHGQNLDGGVVDFDCSNTACHTATGGVFACNNCHYWKGDEGSFVDVLNRTDSTLTTVGMHTSHIIARHSLTVALDCSACHILPDSVWAAGHIDASPYAEVTFDSLSTANDTLSPVWDRSAGTCSQIYCHGAFTYGDVTGNDTTWTWTVPVSGELCGSCHGLPPTGHIASGDACGLCHSGVVSGEDNRTIIDTQKHINGVKNVFGN